MKKKKFLTVLMCLSVTGMLFSGCGEAYGSSLVQYAPSAGGTAADMTEEDGGSYSPGYEPDYNYSSASVMEEWDYSYGNGNTEEYSSITEPGYRAVATEPLSTFSADVDTASYSNLRRMLRRGYTPEEIPQGAVRIEEMLNYFSYDYNLPQEEEPFGVTTVIGDCPWNGEALLLQIGLRTEAIDFSEAPDSNLVFLIDVSGSMEDDDKLPLLVNALKMLVAELGEKDRISIVTYASQDQVILEGVHGDDKETITRALELLTAGGSTNGSAGIRTAYQLAGEYFIEGGNNRVILATDGDLNVGISSESDLEKLITKEKQSGVFLSVLGFGAGNYKDNKMETLADKGNGNYAYIDSIREARKVLVEQMGATLVTVAKDVKLQVEFNPAYVKGYRLIGYEDRMLETADFDDDTKDAGEIGAGHMVTALYEILPVDSRQEIPQTSLRYQDTQARAGVENGEWLTLSIRYKEPESETSKLCTYPVTSEAYQEQPTGDFYFAAAVAELGLLLRDSEYKGASSYESIRELLRLADTDRDEYRSEFADLTERYLSLIPAENEPR